jgi:hypothetical protein
VRYQDVFEKVLAAVRSVVNPGVASVTRAERKRKMREDPVGARLRYGFCSRVPVCFALMPVTAGSR